MAQALIPRQNDLASRIKVLGWFVFIIYIALFARLVYVQLVKGQFYSDDNRRLREKTVNDHPVRASIEDSKGRIVAITSFLGALSCDPVTLRDARRWAERLAPIIGKSPEELERSMLPTKVKTKSGNWVQPKSVLIARGMTPSTTELVKAAITDSRRHKVIPYFRLDLMPIREYPYGQEMVHPVGWVRSETDNVITGAGGVESHLDSQLAGSSGQSTAQFDRSATPIPGTHRVSSDRVDGKTLRLTIDTHLQHIAYSALKSCMDTYQAHMAFATIMDVETGAVLATVSLPSFDPAQRPRLITTTDAFANFVTYPMEFGSVLKPVLAVAALESGAVSPSTTFFCNGSLPMTGKAITCDTHDSNGGKHGPRDLKGMVAASCNVCAAQFAICMGKSAFCSELEKLGVTSKSGVELPFDYTGAISPDIEQPQLEKRTLARVGFGHCVKVNPLSLLSVYCSIANGGYRVIPHVVDSYRDTDGIATSEARIKQQLFSRKTADYVLSALESVVTHGTGTGKTELIHYTTGGKTGTAQSLFRDGKSKGYERDQAVSTYVGVAPISKPRIAVMVTVDRPQAKVRYSNVICGPVFREIAEQALEYLKVPHDKPNVRIDTALVRK